MKFARRDNRSALSARRVILALAVAALLPVLLHGSAPSWWSQRGVLVENATPEDYAPVNQGQLKSIAKAAVTEMDAKLSGGAGAELHSLIASWSPSTPAANDFAPVNLGQLKNVAKPFYNRLITAGLIDFYPWLSSAPPSDDFAVANIGQVKHLFSFVIPLSNSLDDALSTRVAAGQRSGNLAVEANAVWFWGNRFGAESNFQSTYPKRLATLSGITSVSAGDEHLVALATNGTILTWGKNSRGQLGDGTNLDRATPAVIPNMANVNSIKASGAHTLVLKQDGTVFAWGENYYGELGTGDNVASFTPIQVVGLSDVHKIAAGPTRSVALKNDGTVWTWGYDHYDWQTGQEISTNLPSQVANLTDVIDVAAGYEHVVAVKADGTVWASGSNYANQIGNGNPWWKFQDVPAQVPNLANVTKVASNFDHSLALLSDGTVWAWGVNSFGQLGDGTTQARQSPVQVMGLSDVVAIAATYQYSLAMKADGTVWTWGDGSSGTLPGVDLHVPQQVGLGLFDPNHNGMDDRWEMEYLGGLDQPGDADADGDGISNRQEFFRGTDPRDYFNGATAVIEIVSGNNQIGEPGTLLPKPVTVRIKNASGQILANAPIHFRVTSGGALVAARPGEPLQDDLVLPSDGAGQASAYVRVPVEPGVSARIVASPAVPESSVTAAGVSFRASSRFTLPSTPTPSPDPNASPAPSATPKPSPTAAPPPYRYAIIDLGIDVYPLRINNKGGILIAGADSEGNWSYFRWKGGALERLTYSVMFRAVDINDQGVVVGRIDETQTERSAGIIWRSDSSSGQKVAGNLVSDGIGDPPGNTRQASFSAVTNADHIYGETATGGRFVGVEIGVQVPFGLIQNSARWSTDGSLLQILSNGAPIQVVGGHDNWTGRLDTIRRANSAGEYIGRSLVASNELISFTGSKVNLCTSTEMISGQPVSFRPIDLNEAGVVVGSAGADMVVSSSPNSQTTITGASPLAINDHTRPAPSPQPSPGANPQPTPIPAPQILAWAGNALVLWELQEDGHIWHPFGLEEMIPSMDGWQYLEPYDMNDTGAIVGRGWYTDPSDPKAEGEYRAFLLVPVELTDNNKRAQDSLIIPKQDLDERNEKSVAWIDPHGDVSAPDAPVMPQLVLRFPGTDTMELKIKWKLRVEHKRRNGRVVAADTALIPAVGENGDQSWTEEVLDGTLEIYTNLGWTNELQQNGFFGGNAELTYQLLRSDGTALGNEEKMLFYIGGKNPDDAKCKVFITQTATQVQQPMAWFAYAIARHESKGYNGVDSRYNQFWDKAGRFGGVDHEPGEVLWVNNPGEKAPKGFGILQVTGNIVDESADIPRKQLWNWQENVKGGLALVGPKRGVGTRYFERIQKRSTEYRAAFQACPPPSITVGSHAFSSADAIQIYAYNGTGAYNGRPARFEVRYPFDPVKLCGLGSTKRWFWNPHNVAGAEPYIKKVERELEN
jgi:alpha-tubulin suppressor-like RCC1 family protein